MGRRCRRDVGRGDGVAAGVVALRRASTDAPPSPPRCAGAPNAGQPTRAGCRGRGPTLAVLPFENIGPAEDAYFAQGVSDELTSRLTSVSPASG